MRSLTRGQRKMLDVWFKEQKTSGRTLGYFWDVQDDEMFSGELYEKIDSLNPCEIFYQNVNNYIQEKENS